MTALAATAEALAKPFATVCVFCRQAVIRVAHPESSGMCEACLDRLYPDDGPKEAA